MSIQQIIIISAAKFKERFCGAVHFDIKLIFDIKETGSAFVVGKYFLDSTIKTYECQILKSL